MKDRPPAPVALYGAGEGAGSAGIHSVLPGETLYSISKRYDLPLQDIVMVNGLRAPFRLNTGTRLNLPPPREYKVQQGDSISSVARLFSVGPYEITRLNRLSPAQGLKLGQVLRLPAPVLVENIPSSRAQPRHSVTKAGEVEGPSLANLESQGPSTSAGLRPAYGRDDKKGNAEKRTAQKPQPILAKPAPRSAGKFLQPVSGKVISSYGPKPGGLFNDGINIKAPKGAPVRTAENGVVVFAGDGLKGFGNLVLVRHDDQWISAYGHLGKILVRRGEKLHRGQTLGTVGSSGSVDAPQLHFELRRGTEPLNPAPYLEG